MFKFRILTATTLVAIATAFVSSSSLWAKPRLTSAQKKAKDKCIAKFIDDYINCITDHPTLPINDCARAAYSGYEVCLKGAGLSLAENPPPPLPKHDRPVGPTPSGIKPEPPARGKPRPDVRASVAPVLTGPTAEPSPTDTVTKAQAPGGGPGLVWVNTETHVYHKEGSRFYGTTKKGKYMTEAEAIKEGNRDAAKGTIGR